MVEMKFDILDKCHYKMMSNTKKNVQPFKQGNKSNQLIKHPLHLMNISF